MTLGTARTLPAGLLGAVTTPISHTIDARWLMAYAAGLGASADSAYDTAAPEGPRAHPLFPVCYEWPALVALREQVIGDELAPLSVHATHDLVIARPPRDGDHVTTVARLVAIERRRAGALVVARLTTVDAAGRTLTATDYGSVYRGVDTPETGRVAEPLTRHAAPAARTGVTAGRSTASASDVAWTARVELSAGAAHVYTECARIWNPIHTDVAVARRAGLPAIILHGTATLAHAVSCVVDRELAGDSASVRGVAARFTGFVRLPSAVIVRGLGRTAAVERRDGRGADARTPIAFDAVTEDGQSVLGEGVVTA